MFSIEQQQQQLYCTPELNQIYITKSYNTNKIKCMAARNNHQANKIGQPSLGFSIQRFLTERFSAENFAVLFSVNEPKKKIDRR